MRMMTLSMALLALAFAGCAPVVNLEDRDDVPAFIGSYGDERLSCVAGNVRLSLDLDGCVANAAMSSGDISGTSSIVGYFPVRDILARELTKVVVSNFSLTMPGETPDLELRVKSERIIVARDWSRVSSDMEFSIALVDPVDADRKPYFRKNYTLSARSVEKDRRRVPLCIYECLQNLSSGIVRDFAGNYTLRHQLREIGARAGQK